MWMRWNDSTHIFEQSFNDGASWAVLPLNASVINEGAINIARLPANLAVKDANNFFTATQNMTGNLGVSGTSISLSSNFAASVVLNVRNSFVGAGSTSEISLGQDTQSRSLILQSFSSTYASNNIFQASSSVIVTIGGNGLSLGTLDGGPLKFVTNATERVRINAAGEVLINTTTNFALAQLMIAADSTIHPAGLGITNLSGVSIFYCAFYNQGGGTAGYIYQTTSTTVNYATSSDERLKVNFGRFEDLTALRSLIVHDFKWRSDNIRDRGIFAQEAYEHFPRAIRKGGDELTENGQLANPWMIDYSKFVPDLIAGWQAHDGQLIDMKEKLRTELDGIQNELRSLVILYEELKKNG